MKTPKQQADQAEKELLSNPEIDNETKKTITDFRKWCKSFPEKVDDLLRFVKAKK